MEHTIEPLWDFETVNTANYDEPAWAEGSVYWFVNPHCSYCNAPIEANDPEYQWSHIGE